MPTITDTHVHLYPCYDPGALFSHALRNLAELRRSLAPAERQGAAADRVQYALFLTEARQNRFFRRLCDGGVRMPQELGRLEPAGRDCLVARGGEAAGGLYLFPGRQIVTRDGIEVLALLADLDIPDGRPLDEVMGRVLAEGAVPVLPWSPGKWFGARGEIVRQVLEQVSPAEVLVGDTTLRPYGWHEPMLMRAAAAHGFRVVAGSDPLPFAGEERWAGRYGTVFGAALDDASLTDGARRMLLDPKVTLRRCGRRSYVSGLLWRLWRNHRSKGGQAVRR